MLVYRGELHIAVFHSVLFDYSHRWADTPQEIFLQHNQCCICDTF